MLIFFIILLFIAALVGIILYIFKREWFVKHQGIVEYEGILLSLIIALITVNQTQSGIDSSTKDFNDLISRLDTIVTRVDSATKSVTKVEQSLSNLPPQIDNFANSINSMNSIIIKQKEELSNTLTSFNSSIQSFKSSVDSMVVRFNRKPDIKFDIHYTDNDSLIKVTGFVLTNYGNLMANSYQITLQIPEKYFIKIDWKGYTQNHKQGDCLSFACNYNDAYLQPDSRKPVIIDCNIDLKKSVENYIKIFVYYTAAFGNDGNEYQVFSLNKINGIWTFKKLIK